MKKYFQFLSPLKTLDFRTRIFLGFLVLAGLFFRLLIIHKFYLGSDESWHVEIANQSSLRDVISYNFADNVHPPLYGLLLHLVLLFTHQVGALRALNLLPWLLWVGACFAVGRRIGGDRQGVIWVGLAATCFIFVEQSLALREYMWLELFLTLQFYYFLELYDRPSPNAWIKYLLCGLAAISFHYSAVIAIFCMGFLFAWRLYLKSERSLKEWVISVLTHLILAGYFGLLYEQHSFHKLENILFYDRYYYGAGSFWFFLVNLNWAVISLIHIPDILKFGLLLLGSIVLLAGPFLLSRKPTVVRNFFILSIIMMFALSATTLYPTMFNCRYMSWMWPGIMAAIAMAIEYSCKFIPSPMRIKAAILAVVTLLTLNITSLDFQGAFTQNDYKKFVEAIDKINKRDIIIADIQTMMTLKVNSTWQEVAVYPHYNEALWNGHRIFYPNWYKLDMVDTKTGKAVGGTTINLESLTYFSQSMGRDRLGAETSIWWIQIGFPPNLNVTCFGKTSTFGHMQWYKRSEKTYGGVELIVQFRPEDFQRFISSCPEKTN